MSSTINRRSALDWAIRPFPNPRIIAANPNPDCPCSWVWAPDVTGEKEFPFIIKHPNRFCREHAKDYFGGIGIRA